MYKYISIDIFINALYTLKALFTLYAIYTQYSRFTLCFFHSPVIIFCIMKSVILN